MKKIGIVGAGASGLYAALLIKKKHPNYDVTIFEKEAKIGRKLLATGNGHCNLLNSSISGDKFNNKFVLNKYLKRYPFETLSDTIHDFGIATTNIDDLIYPISYSATSFVNSLIAELEGLGVKFRLNTYFLNYQKTSQNIVICTDNGDFCADNLLICTGGKSNPNLGSNGSIFPILEKHGYHISPLRAGLAPIIVKEKKHLRDLSGERHKGSVSLLRDGKLISKEEGEILYKSDGLSGIAIFNLSSLIQRFNDGKKYTFIIDLFPGLNLSAELNKAYLVFGENFLNSFFTSKLKNEIIRQYGHDIRSVNEIPSLEKKLHKLEYTYEDTYSFQNSQVSIGGLSLNDLDDSLMSKNEKNISFLGEVLDIDGLCGGYNLSWALLSALIVSDSL